jgi:hypothetical protein
MKRALKIITLILFLGCERNYAFAQDLYIKINNKTGDDVDSLEIGSTYVGRIDKDSSTKFIRFSEFHFLSFYPYESIFGYVQNKALGEWWWAKCRTSYREVKSGKYIFDLMIGRTQGVDYFYLAELEEKK